MRILIVEDDSSTRAILRRYMKPLGEIEVAGDGRAAVEAHAVALDQGRPYGLILLDIMMPVMDGQAALKAIRELEKQRRVPYGQEVKVVMVTCLGDTRSVCDAFFKGMATGYVEKPFTRSSLYAELESIGIKVNA